MSAYDRFIDADQNRVAWVEVFRAFDKAITELRELAPRTAAAMTTRFFEEAAQPLVKAERGLEFVKDIEAEVSGFWPLSWDEAEVVARETGGTPYQAIQEHREWGLKH